MFHASTNYEFSRTTPVRALERLYQVSHRLAQGERKLMFEDKKEYINSLKKQSEPGL